jgi:hypothetical protein
VEVGSPAHKTEYSFNNRPLPPDIIFDETPPAFETVLTSITYY